MPSCQYEEAEHDKLDLKGREIRPRHPLPSPGKAKTRPKPGPCAETPPRRGL
jgi:hypothetical protein